MPAQPSTSMKGEDLSDIELVDRLLRGASGMFDLFYRRHKRMIYHCIRARADAVDVDDLAQGFFERLVTRDYRVLRLWQRGTSLPIYLAIVIRNYVSNFYVAKRSRQKTADALSSLALIDIPPVKKGMTSGAPIKGEEITSAIELRELRRFSLQAWAELEFRDRFLTCGKLHRELSNEAMSERLKLTEGALRTALSRAQRKLLTGLKTRAPEYFPV